MVCIQQFSQKEILQKLGNNGFVEEKKYYIKEMTLKSNFLIEIIILFLLLTNSKEKIKYISPIAILIHILDFQN